MDIFRSLAKDVSEMLAAGCPKEEVRQWAYERLGTEPSADAALWWCQALASLWLLALQDSDLFPDLEFEFAPVLEGVLLTLRADHHKTKDLAEYALWLQAQLLRFFWNGSSSLREISEIESLGSLILELAHENDVHFDFFSELAFPPSFIAQDWSSFQENRLRILRDSFSPQTHSPRRQGTRLTQILARKWGTAVPESDRRLG